MKYRKETSFLIAGALGIFLIYLYQDMSDHKYLKAEVITRPPPRKRAPKVNPVKSTVFSWPKCEANVSAANVSGFSTLPARVQNFLTYRHCRHFPQILDIPDKCGGPENSSHVFLLLVIKSLPANYDRREVLRKTWARERTYKGLWIRRIFAVGTQGSGAEKLKLNKHLEIEQKLFNDILQWDFTESHFNLTVKQVLFLEWRERNCPNARFLLNGDDDVFANTDNMVEYLQGLPDNDGSKHLFAGQSFSGDHPDRDASSKYYVPVQVQESDSYPPYCFGGGYLLSQFTVSAIYNVSHSIPLHPLDDIFIAMCVEKAGFEPEYHYGVGANSFNVPFKEDGFDPCFFREILLVHRYLPKELLIMWNKVQDPELNCKPVHNKL